MNSIKAITIKILNKEYQINCPEGAEDELHETAHYLDQKMRDIRNGGRVIGLEKMAIIAALNTTHELLVHRREKEIYVHSVTEHIKRLQNKIDNALINDRILENSTE